ncbi:ATP-binding protein [Nocardioides sp. 503]|uniref:ATP-binding protein n=1 Tax=Nocardioides sp. 503 TaxID=2508326 RepID=UPI00106F9265|nr:ATP-binding protein [Nocardioides sp. 503]
MPPERPDDTPPAVVPEKVLEEELALLYDEAPFGYLSTTPDGYIVRVNATLCTWLGLGADEVLGLHLTDLLTAGGRIYHETHYAPMVQMQGFVREIAVDIVRADGSRLPVLLNATLVRSPDGEPRLVRVAVFDATQRRAYERELVRTRDKQQAELRAQAAQVASATATVSQIIDAATSTLLVATDADMIVTHFNRGAELMLGHAAQDVVGRPSAGILGVGETLRQAEDLGVSPDSALIVAALVHHGRPRDWHVTTASGESRTMSLSFTEIRDEHRLIGYLCAGEDISVRLGLEAAQAAALQRELQSVARLQEADRMKDEVVSTISHELRTPIASIQGYGELLADGDLGELTPGQSGAVEKMLRNAARLSALVEDLLHLDRIGSAEEVPLHLAPHDLAALVVEARDSLAQLARSRDLTLDVQVPEEHVLVLSDAQALERVVLNLGDNAIKFTPDGGSVTLTVATTPAGCVLTVADTGIGMSEEDRDRVRGRFYRSSEAYRLAVPGTGLGLSVVEAIVAVHGGTLDIASTLGGGTAVTVVLPAYVPEA